MYMLNKLCHNKIPKHQITKKNFQMNFGPFRRLMSDVTAKFKTAYCNSKWLDELTNWIGCNDTIDID